ncbi:MAG TPA: hypothetical protein VNY73_03600 [Bacteroidia bacterium]|nr:hypothetical protein [Bacteroidia bacterium]
MRKFYFILFITTLLSSQSPLASELPKKKKKDKDTTEKTGLVLSIGGGGIYTSLNFFKNYQEQTYYGGNGVRVLAQFNDLFRVCLSRDEVNSIDIPPVWLNVKSVYYDLDLHIISHFWGTENLGYLILGASSQYWNGFYTGINDFNAWKLNIPRNTYYHTLYYGATVGVGTEIKLVGPLSLYGEFRFRLSKTDLGTGLNDVLYGGGLKLNLATIKKPKEGRHHSILKFRDKYHWF